MHRRGSIVFAKSGRFFGLIFILICTGCVVVPVGWLSKSPYRPEVMQKLSQKDTDRNLVRLTLGSPKAVKSGGRYWFYANSRETWGIIGGSSSGVFTEDEWLAVQFDDAGRVIFLEHNSDSCLSNGMCHLGGLFTTQPSEIVVTAPTLQDAAAKSYQVSADECAVYLFLKSLPWPLDAGRLKFSVDGRGQGLVNDKSYLFLTHPQGKISISAYQFTIAAQCMGGEKLYVGADKGLDWSWETGRDLSSVNAVEGEAAIRTRRLALPK